MGRRRFALFRLPAVARRHGRRIVWAVFGFVSAVVSVGLIALAAAWAHQPLVFPSLGPTAYLVFDRPRAVAAAPRNILFGHTLAVACGYLALTLFGLRDTPVHGVHMTLARAGAAALSLGLVAGIMLLVAIPHPPAAATTLIVSLGLLTRPAELAALLAAVVVLVVEGLVIDRLVGLDVPLWASAATPRPEVRADRRDAEPSAPLPDGSARGS